MFRIFLVALFGQHVYAQQCKLFGDQDYSTNEGFEIDAKLGDYEAQMVESNSMSSIFLEPGCKLEFWDQTDKLGTKYQCDASSGSVTSFGKPCDLSKTGGDNRAESYECTCPITQFPQSDSMIWRSIEMDAVGYSQWNSSNTLGEYFGPVPENFEVSFEFYYTAADLNSGGTNTDGSLGGWKTIFAGQIWTDANPSINPINWWWGINQDQDFRIDVQPYSTWTGATAPNHENWPVEQEWHKSRVILGQLLGLRIYLDDKLVYWQNYNAGNDKYQNINYVRWGPYRNYPPLNQNIRYLEFKEYTTPENVPTCGSLYENDDLTGWEIQVDPYGENAYSLDFGDKYDEMSAIKVVPGCRIQMYGASNFNGNYNMGGNGHTYFECDNTDGTEDKICDVLDIADDTANSYQCACGLRYPIALGEDGFETTTAPTTGTPYNTDCLDGTHNCADGATCLQGDTQGYLCQCPPGQIGDGFKVEVGGKGCPADACEYFTIECSNDNATVTINTDCGEDNTMKWLDWENFYIGIDDADQYPQCRFNDDNANNAIIAMIDFQQCGTTTDTGDNEIIHENMVSYADDGPFNFFTGFDIRCVVSQNLNITLGGESEVVIDISDVSMVQDMKDEINLSDHVALTLFNVPEGHSMEFRLGEEITLGLDFTKLDEALDYRFDKCWAKKADNTEIYILGAASDAKNGCPAWPWVSTDDQEGFTVPSGFVRPNFITFPIFTVDDNASQLIIGCSFFICEQSDPSCNVDEAACNASRRRRRAAEDDIDPKRLLGVNVPLAPAETFNATIEETPANITTNYTTTTQTESESSSQVYNICLALFIFIAI